MSHLKLRHQTYYVRKRVPTALVPIMGKTEVMRTTGAKNLKQAQSRSHAILADIEADFQRAAGLASTQPASPVWVQHMARGLQMEVTNGTMDQETAAHLMHDTVERHLTAAGVPADDIPEDHLTHLQTSYRLFTHPQDLPLSEAIRQHLADREGRVEASTLKAKARALTAFTDWLQTDRPIKDVTRQEAGAYVTHLSGRGVSPKTNIDAVSVLSTLFNWAIRKGLYDSANPFAGHAADLRGSRRGASSERRRPWTQAEIKAFVLSLPADDVRRQAVLLALYTGMRLNEICHLEITDVNLAEDFMSLPEGKTESSVRQVPIHPAIKPLLERLVAKSSDGFLLSGLKPGGADEKRGHSLSKRIGRYLRVNCKITDKGVVFHSLRSTFIHAAENAAVPESTVKLLVGHARQSMTYGVYSKGVDLPVLQKAIKKVTFGPLDAVAAGGAGEQS